MTEDDGREILSGVRAEAIVKIVESAWNAHVAERVARSRRTRANVLWDYMTQFADRELTGMEGVRRYELHGIPMYVFDERLVGRFKKHSLELLTHNIPTGHQLQITFQGHLEGMPKLEHVSLGYVLDPAEAELRRVVAVRRIGNRLDWAIDLRELVAGIRQPATPILPVVEPAADAPLPRIAPIRREQDGDDGE